MGATVLPPCAGWSTADCRSRTGAITQPARRISATMPMQWDDLRFLIAVSDSGSVSAAARNLGVDKGTVSRRIAALEHSVGTRLFDRKSSGWTATPAGRKTMGTARKVEAGVMAL